MALKFACPACRKKLEVKLSDLGSDLGCPHCRTPIKLPGDPLTQGFFLGEFQIGTPIGGGSDGSVHFVFDSSGATFALRVPHEELIGGEHNWDRFLNMVSRFREFNHFNLVRIITTGHIGDVHFYVMEYSGGASLSQRIRRGPQSESETLRILEQMTMGLNYLHQNNFIPLDLHSGKVQFDAANNAKLSDYGLARPLFSGIKSTQDWAVHRLPHSISPEQATGHQAVDARSNLYSFGAIAFGMLTGRPLFFNKTTELDLLAAHIEIPAPDVRDFVEVTAPTAIMIKKLLAKDPRDRFQSAAQLLAIIRVARGGSSRPVATSSQPSMAASSPSMPAMSLPSPPVGVPMASSPVLPSIPMSQPRIISIPAPAPVAPIPVPKPASKPVIVAMPQPPASSSPPPAVPSSPAIAVPSVMPPGSTPVPLSKKPKTLVNRSAASPHTPPEPPLPSPPQAMVPTEPEPMVPTAPPPPPQPVVVPSPPPPTVTVPTPPAVPVASSVSTTTPTNAAAPVSSAAVTIERAIEKAVERAIEKAALPSDSAPHAPAEKMLGANPTTEKVIAPPSQRRVIGLKKQEERVETNPDAPVEDHRVVPNPSALVPISTASLTPPELPTTDGERTHTITLGRLLGSLAMIIIVGYLAYDLYYRYATANHKTTTLIAGTKPAPVPTGVPTGISPPPGANLNDSLVLHLKFDGNTQDSSGHNNQAIAKGGTGFDTGKNGQALNLKKRQYLTLSHPTELNFGSETDFTVSFWIWADNFQDNEPVILSNKDCEKPENPGWVIAAQKDAASWQWSFKGSKKPRIEFNKGGKLTDKQWHQITISHVRKGNAVFYQDGQLLGSISIKDAGDIDSTLPLNIGRDGNGEFSLNGYVKFDDFRIWRRALHESEIKRLFQ